MHVADLAEQDKPEDFVIATGEQHSVREFCRAGLRTMWASSWNSPARALTSRKGYRRRLPARCWSCEVSPDFYRPTDVVNLWGDPTKAKRELGWNPTKTTFAELVKIMVDHDMKKVAVERAEEHIQTNLAEYLEKGVIK